MVPVAFSLGSNLGKRENYLWQAIQHLAAQVKVCGISDVFSTKAWGVKEQPDFLNVCVLGETEYEPLELLKICKKIENLLGRKKTFRWGPREIDIDIVFYGEERIDLPELTIPHPHSFEREFVLAPLFQLAPEWEHPILRKTVAEQVKEMDLKEVKFFKKWEEIENGSYGDKKDF
jgi:2-amino-4-hydroxy-6-hydroxymethyldihydropteridine diphosphokinase